MAEADSAKHEADARPSDQPPIHGEWTSGPEARSADENVALGERIAAYYAGEVPPSDEPDNNQIIFKDIIKKAKERVDGKS